MNFQLSVTRANISLSVTRVYKINQLNYIEFRTICYACLNTTFNTWFSSFFKLINQFFSS